jgi:hypothetical protein
MSGEPTFAEERAHRILSAVALLGGGTLANVEAIQKTIRDLSLDEVQRGCRRLVALGLVKARHTPARVIGTYVSYEMTPLGHEHLRETVAS